MTNSESFLLIMPSYNQAHYIASAVDSILVQDDRNWTLWIVDNSSDNTPVVMQKYKDPRVHFVHISERMDPGTCLNMILEQEGYKHREFSYVHTDNLLRTDYVQKMRKALANADHSVAYCDMRSLDEHGKYTGVFRRGSFDLARLFSLSTLGVPFSATTKLFKEIGGFNRMDVADDVIFCVRAWPKARFEYISDAIMDYRLHSTSRTTAHGGAAEIERSFLLAFRRLLPEMAQQGAYPTEALALRLAQLHIDMELKVEDLWYREGAATNISIDHPNLEALYAQGLLDLCALQEPHAPDLSPPDRGLKRIKGKAIKRWRKIKSKLNAKLNGKLNQPNIAGRMLDRGAVADLSTQFRNHAVSWLYLAASEIGGPETPMRLASTDIYTLWTTLALHRILGWRFQIDPSQPLDRLKWHHLDFCSNESTFLSVSVAPNQISVRKSE